MQILATNSIKIPCPMCVQSYDRKKIVYLNYCAYTYVTTTRTIYWQRNGEKKFKMVAVCATYVCINKFCDSKHSANSFISSKNVFSCLLLLVLTVCRYHFSALSVFVSETRDLWNYITFFSLFFANELLNQNQNYTIVSTEKQPSKCNLFSRQKKKKRIFSAFFCFFCFLFEWTIERKLLRNCVHRMICVINWHHTC